MRITKYLILGLLVISVTKKIYLSDNGQPLPFKLALSQKDAQVSTNSIKEPDLSKMVGLYDPIAKTATITFHNVVEYNKSVTPPNLINKELKLFGAMTTPNQNSSKATLIRPGGIRPITTLYGIPEKNEANNSEINQDTLVQDARYKGDDLEHYDRSSRTATLKNGKLYVGVVEYSQAVTPPNISNPALKSFATIATPNFVQSSSMAGARRPKTTLFGIPVSGDKLPVKSDSNNIGFYWPENKIVQLNNGETLVCIIEEKQGNYKKTGAHAIGPVYTWFSSDDLKQYGISNMDSDFKSRVQQIGTIKTDHARVTLNGVKISGSSSFGSIAPQRLSHPSDYFNYLERNKTLSDREKANSVIGSITKFLGTTPSSRPPLTLLSQSSENN